MLLDDRRMKVRGIPETIGVSKERVGYICMKNWIYRILRLDFFRILHYTDAGGM